MTLHYIDRDKGGITSLSVVVYYLTQGIGILLFGIAFLLFGIALKAGGITSLSVVVYYLTAAGRNGGGTERRRSAGGPPVSGIQTQEAHTLRLRETKEDFCRGR